MKEQKALSHYGPGGRKCPCCGPGPNERKVHDRTVKRRAKQMWRREIQKEILDCNE